MDYTTILNNVDTHISLDEEEKEYFISLLEYKKVKRKTHLVNRGEVARHTYFIIKGCLRNYEMDRDGNVHIGLFAMEDWWVSDLHSFLTQTPSHGYVEAIEDSELYCLSKQNYEKLFEKVPKFERFFRILHQNAYISLKNRLVENLSIEARERYINFVEKYPSLNQRIPQKQIASYLGITPEFLSMLRNRLAKK